MLFRDEFGGVENIEFELVGEGVVKELQTEFPFWKVSGLDGVPKIAAMKVGIGTVDFDRFIPNSFLSKTVLIFD